MVQLLHCHARDDTATHVLLVTCQLTLTGITEAKVPAQLSTCSATMANPRWCLPFFPLLSLIRFIVHVSDASNPASRRTQRKLAKQEKMIASEFTAVLCSCWVKGPSGVLGPAVCCAEKETQGPVCHSVWHAS